jgi:hypothetical protein
MNFSDPQRDPVQAMLAATSLRTSLFAPTSRYHGLETTTLVQDGVPVAYVKRRFVPPPESFRTLQVHTVVQGERLDVVTARYFGDPTLYWRLCDANRAMRPWRLTEASGRRLAITLPQDISGAAL